MEERSTTNRAGAGSSPVASAWMTSSRSGYAAASAMARCSARSGRGCAVCASVSFPCTTCIRTCRTAATGMPASPAPRQRKKTRESARVSSLAAKAALLQRAERRFESFLTYRGRDPRGRGSSFQGTSVSRNSELHSTVLAGIAQRLERRSVKPYSLSSILSIRPRQ